MKKIIIISCIFILICSFSSQAEPINDAIISRIMTDNQLDEEMYEIEILSNRLKIKDVIPEQIRIKPLSQKEPLGLYTVIIQVLSDGDIKEAGQVRMRVKKYDNVLVASDRFKRHEDITVERTAVERKEITNLVSQPLYSIDESAGLRVKSSIKKDAVITRSMLESIPDIEIGKEMNIVYTDGAFKITAGEFKKNRTYTSRFIAITVYG